jgi:delta(3,5)-delta(2,4)-dienoyl-CoA isomerase
MWLELKQVFDHLADDPSVRTIVFSGAGDMSFCSGLDLQNAAQEGSVFNPRQEDIGDPARRAFKVRRWALQFQDCLTSIERCEKRKLDTSARITYFPCNYLLSLPKPLFALCTESALVWPSTLRLART